MQGNQTGGHEWLVEFEKEPENLTYFIQKFDEELKKRNSDYEAKRVNDLIMRAPVIRILPKGTFYEWLKSKGKLGGQNKVPRLANNRELIDELNSFICVY